MSVTIDRLIRRLLADDEAIIRAGIRAILASDPELDVVPRPPTGGRWSTWPSATPDVALLDIRMPRLRRARGGGRRSAGPRRRWPW